MRRRFYSFFAVPLRHHDCDLLRELNNAVAPRSGSVQDRSNVAHVAMRRRRPAPATLRFERLKVAVLFLSEVHHAIAPLCPDPWLE